MRVLFVFVSTGNYQNYTKYIHCYLLASNCCQWNSIFSLSFFQLRKMAKHSYYEQFTSLSNGEIEKKTCVPYLIYTRSNHYSNGFFIEKKETIGFEKNKVLFLSS